MRSIFKIIVGACTVASALATSVPAQARHDGYRNYREHRWNHGGRHYRDYDRPRFRHHYRYGYRDNRHFRYYPHGYYRYGGHPRVYYRDYYRDNDDGALLAAGIIGLALGAAIASNNDRDRYYDRDYDYGY